MRTYQKNTLAIKQMKINVFKQVKSFRLELLKKTHIRNEDVRTDYRMTADTIQRRIG